MSQQDYRYPNPKDAASNNGMMKIYNLIMTIMIRIQMMVETSNTDFHSFRSAEYRR